MSTPPPTPPAPPPATPEGNPSAAHGGIGPQHQACPREDDRRQAPGRQDPRQEEGRVRVWSEGKGGRQEDAGGHQETRGEPGTFLCFGTRERLGTTQVTGWVAALSRLDKRLWPRMLTFLFVSLRRRREPLRWILSMMHAVFWVSLLLHVLVMFHCFFKEAIHRPYRRSGFAKRASSCSLLEDLGSVSPCTRCPSLHRSSPGISVFVSLSHSACLLSRTSCCFVPNG